MSLLVFVTCDHGVCISQKGNDQYGILVVLDAYSHSGKIDIMFRHTQTHTNTHVVSSKPMLKKNSLNIRPSGEQRVVTEFRFGEIGQKRGRHRTHVQV